MPSSSNSYGDTSLAIQLLKTFVGPHQLMSRLPCWRPAGVLPSANQPFTYGHRVCPGVPRYEKQPHFMTL